MICGHPSNQHCKKNYPIKIIFSCNHASKISFPCEETQTGKSPCLALMSQLGSTEHELLPCVSEV